MAQPLPHIHSANLVMRSSLCSGSVLGTGDVAVTNAGKDHCPEMAYIIRGSITSKGHINIQIGIFPPN